MHECIVYVSFPGESSELCSFFPIFSETIFIVYKKQKEIYSKPFHKRRNPFNRDSNLKEYLGILLKRLKCTIYVVHRCNSKGPFIYRWHVRLTTISLKAFSCLEWKRKPCLLSKHWLFSIVDSLPREQWRTRWELTNSQPIKTMH